MLWQKNSTIKTLTLVRLFSIISLIAFCYCPNPAVMGATINTTGTTSLNKTGVPNLTSGFLTSYGKGVALLNSGKYNESIPYFDKALAINPKDFYALYNKGAALLNLQKYNESIPYFDKALAINPKDFYALYNKGAALSKTGRYNESITYFDKALSIEPANTNALAAKKLDLAAMSKTNTIVNHTGTTETTQTSTATTAPAENPSTFGFYFGWAPHTNPHKLH
jgi:tetratricopeptide (TPR) repeat protein